MLAKKFNDIKSNLESIGLFIGKIIPRKEDGQHYFIKRSKSSTSSTALQESSYNEGLRAVDKAVKAVDSAVDTDSSTAETNPSTADKASVYAETVDTVDDVDKNGAFGGGWVMVTDEEVPQEFLKQSTAPASAPRQEQLKI